MTEQRMKVQKFIDAKIQLMDLLPEIRQVILEHLCEETTIPVFLRSNCCSPTTGINLPVTARMGNVILRQETIRIALEKATFRIDSFPGDQAFQSWLEKVDLRQVSKTYVNGFDAIKHVQNLYFSRFPHWIYLGWPSDSDVELMLKCRNLETVDFVWVPDEISNKRHLKTVEELRKELGLDRLLGLANLKQLRVKWRGFASKEDIELLRVLAEWFSQNLVGKGGSKVEVLFCRQGYECQ